MPKKILLLLLIIPLLFCSGCAPRELINDKTGDINPGKNSEYHDGTYQAVTQYYDALGYAQSLTLEIHAGILSKAVFQEKDMTGALRQDGTSWPPETLQMSLSDIYHKLITSVIKHQSDEIDAVSGATKTSSTFALLASAALKKAINDDRSIAVICPEETYSATLTTSDGYLCSLMITFNDKDVISAVSYDETLNGISRSGNALYKQLFSEMAQATQKSGSLNAILIDSENTEIINHYNALLKKIAEQRIAVQ